MKVSKVLIVCLLLLALGGALYYFLRPKPDSDTLVLYGNVDVRQVDLGFRVAGRVETLVFQEGDFVATGQLMATLERQPYLDQFHQAEAELAAAKLTFGNGEKLLQRRKSLIGDGSISKEDLEDATTNRDVFEANVLAAEAALGVARKNLRDTELFCPSDGTILTRIREPGTVVNPSEPVYTLSVTSPLWIRAFVNEPDLGKIYPGMEGEVHTDTPGTPIYKAKIGFISPVAEFTPKTVETTSLRTDLVYRLRVYVPDPGWNLKQGMPVTLKLPLTPMREEPSGG